MFVVEHMQSSGPISRTGRGRGRVGSGPYPRPEGDDLQDAFGEKEAAEYGVHEDDNRHVEDPAGARVHRLELRCITSHRKLSCQ